MQTSPKGVAFIEAHEGVVLKAYRDPVGIWTIGAGLTAASGVVKPKAGMVITRGEAANLLQKALRRNYEPRVAKAMPNARSHEFDGAVSFDWNTGAIHRASWVKAWKAGDKPNVAYLLGQWVKGGGKVLPGLVRRRKEEADIINFNIWPAGLKVVGEAELAPADKFAVFVVSINDAEIAAVRQGFRTVGFEPGGTTGKVLRSAVEAFQVKYALTVDGKIGRATLSTLQRELDARSGAKIGAGTAIVGGGGAAGSDVIASPAPATPGAELLDGQLVTWAGVAVGLLALAYLTYLAWHYRDLIAARIAPTLPRVAAFLRSF
jgi:lysozyme